MGIFSSAKNDSAVAPSKVAAPSEVAGSSEIGTFHSVHPIDTVMDVVRQGLRSQVSSGEMVLGEPGVLASIYMSELTESRLVVTAGNVLDTYFSFGVELTSDDDGTHGRAYYDRPLAQIERWSHNAMDQASAVQSILIDASATIDGWELMGSR